MPSIRPTLTDIQALKILRLLRADTATQLAADEFDIVNANRKLDNMLVSKCIEAGIRVISYNQSLSVRSIADTSIDALNEAASDAELATLAEKRQGYKQGEQLPETYIAGLMDEFSKLSKP